MDRIWMVSGRVVWADYDRVVGVTTSLVCFWTSEVCLSERRVCRVGHLFFNVGNRNKVLLEEVCCKLGPNMPTQNRNPIFVCLYTTNLSSGCETQY
jgi:hypothetical protein